MLKSKMTRRLPRARAERAQLKIGLLAAAVTLAVCAPLAQAEDLMQIYTLAHAADPSLAGSEATKFATQEGAPQARSVLLPQIGGSYGIGYDRAGSKTSYRNLPPELINPQNGDSTFSSPYSYNFGATWSKPFTLSVTQSLFNWSNIETLRQQNALAEGADYTYDAAVQDLIVRTATAYFNVLTAEDQLAFAKQNQESLQKQLDQADERFKVGLAAITDVDQARAQRDAAVATTISDANAIDTAREAVTQIIGKEFGELNKLRDPVPLDKPQPETLQAWVDIANQQSPLIVSAQKSVNAAEYNVSAKRAGHLPTLTASFQRSDNPSWANLSGTDGTYPYRGIGKNGLVADSTIGVTLNVPIFSGGLVTSQTRQAAFQRDEAQDQLELQRRTTVANTRNSYRAVISGISEVEAAKSSVESAQSALDATKAGYEVGTKTILDVLSAQSTLVQAQSTYSQVRHQFVLSGLQLRQSAGIVAVKDVQAVNALLIR